MIRTIYLDMDDVIVDFRKGCEKYDAIEGKKVDWKIIHSLGKDFWAELEWFKDGEQFYNWLADFCKKNKIDLCILSSVGYQDGIDGKQVWLDNHTAVPKNNRYIVRIGRDKAKFAEPDALLIDDFGKNIEAFVMAGGQAIRYTGMEQAKQDLMELI